jgi:hypothetical protein
VVDRARDEHHRVLALQRERPQHDPVRAARPVHGEHRPVGALRSAAKRSASPKIPVWSTSVPKNPAEIDTSDA